MLLGSAYDHRHSLLVLVPLLFVATVLQSYNLTGSPQRIDDEGTYVAQAYAILHLGELTHYTYWYDHPPLGWLQLAGYAGLSGAFDRASSAVLAGREFMVLAHLASCVLLWLLARRTEMSRWASAGALVVFAASPLSVEYHRYVYLDNIATPWVLAAFVLACTPKPRMRAFAGAAAAFSVAVLTKETFLLLLPVLVWLVWRNARPDSRGFTLTVVGSVVVYSGLAYALFALVRGELFPSGDGPSLWDGVVYQLFGRGPSGSPLDPESLAYQTVGAWLELDVLLPAVGVAGALTGLFSRRLRPYAAGLLFLMLFMLRPGYLPVPYVIAMLPLFALTGAGVAEVAVRHTRKVQAEWRPSGSRFTIFGFTAVRLLPLRSVKRHPLVPIVVTAAVLLVVVAVPAWTSTLRGSLFADADRPMREASTWVLRNVDPAERVMVDDALWVDLYAGGLPRDNVVWFATVGTDPGVLAQTPEGWRDFDVIVETSTVRRIAAGLPHVRAALREGRAVAQFGTGDDRVVIRRLSAEDG